MDDFKQRTRVKSFTLSTITVADYETRESDLFKVKQLLSILTLRIREYKESFVCQDLLVCDEIYQKLVLRVSSGVPNTEKLIVSRCLGPLMKHEARVFGRAS